MMKSGFLSLLLFLVVSATVSAADEATGRHHAMFKTAGVISGDQHRNDHAHDGMLHLKKWDHPNMKMNGVDCGEGAAACDWVLWHTQEFSGSSDDDSKRTIDLHIRTKTIEKADEDTLTTIANAALKVGDDFHLQIDAVDDTLWLQGELYDGYSFPVTTADGIVVLEPVMAESGDKTHYTVILSNHLEQNGEATTILFQTVHEDDNEAATVNIQIHGYAADFIIDGQGGATAEGLVGDYADANPMERLGKQVWTLGSGNNAGDRRDWHADASAGDAVLLVDHNQKRQEMLTRSDKVAQVQQLSTASRRRSLRAGRLP